MRVSSKITAKPWHLARRLPSDPPQLPGCSPPPS
jgi:hypothetical protein